MTGERRRGRPRSLTRDAVVTAALRLLRAEGLEALTFRRLAASLGVVPNSLYTYFDSKDALLAELLDEVLAPVAATPRRRSWRRDVEAVLEATRAVLLEHADLVPLFLTRQSVGPNAVALGDRILGGLRTGGVDDRRAPQALRALLVFTVGFAAFESTRRADPQAHARRRKAHAVFEAAAEHHRHIGALAADVAQHPAAGDFRAGLGWILDGVSPK